MTFYEKLIKLISNNGVTKNKVTQDLGLSKNAFVDWEKRGNIPSGETVAKLADYFNTTTDYLLGKTDNPNLPEDKEIRDEDIQFALFDGTKEITPEMFEEVKAFAKFVQNREAEKGKDKKKD